MCDFDIGFFVYMQEQEEGKPTEAEAEEGEREVKEDDLQNTKKENRSREV